MEVTNLKEFNLEIDKFTESVPEKVTVLQKKIAFEAIRRIPEKTPVDTGRAKGNWQITIGSPAGAILELFDKDGNPTIAKAMAQLQNLPPYQVVYITNNVHYIIYLENGHSMQAPAGMVSVTIEELRQLFA